MVTLRTCDGEQVLAEMSGPLYGTVYRVEGGKIAGKVNTPAGNLYSLIVLCDKDIALTKGDVLHATPVTTRFRKLNGKWNAEPNAPNVSVKVEGSDVVVTFRKDPRFSSDDTGTLRFRSCQRYRLGSPSYEDWRRGKCRFSKVVPKWGEFYEVYDDLLLDACPDDWVEVGSGTGRLRHFLFYFRDNTFECDAEDWGWDWD